MGSLSFVFPDDYIRAKKIVDRGEIELPYGFYPGYKKDSKIDVNLFFNYDTVSYVVAGITGKYRKSNAGFIVAPTARYEINDDTLGSLNIYPVRERFGLFADVTRGVVFMDFDRFKFSAGKDIFSVGSAMIDNPVLSPNVPLNFFRFDYFSDNFGLVHFISRLDDYTGVERIWKDDSSDIVSTYQRYLGIHRFEFKPFDNLGLSFSEIILIGGEYSGFPFELLSPLNFYYAERFNRGRSANVFWNLDARILLGRTLIYIDFLVDDFQYESDPEPNHLGLLLGLYGFDFIEDGTVFFLKYSMMSRWIYSNQVVWHRYNNSGFPLGTGSGNDFDKIEMRSTYPIGDFDVGLNLVYERKGENRIDTPWPVEQTDDYQFPETNFLSGVVEKSIKISGVVNFKDYIDLNMGICNIKNYKHQGDNSLSELFAKLYIHYPIR